MAFFVNMIPLRMNLVNLIPFYLDTGLSFIGTDPQYERRGAATALMKSGLDRCCRSNVPAYLESTLKAVPFYERLGFKIMCRVTISLGESIAYEEACCLYEPCIEMNSIEKGSKASI